MSNEVGRRRRLLIHGLWIGPLLTFAAMVSYFQIFARFPVFRDFPWINLPLVVLGLLLTFAGMWSAFSRPTRIWVRIAGTVGFLFAVLIGGFFLTYVFAISYQLPGMTATTEGISQTPDFELSDHRGRLHRLSGYRDQRVILVFYRGHW